MINAKTPIFFLHSAGPQGPHEGSSDLVAWLKRQLGPGVSIVNPVMPKPDDPDYAGWKAALKQELAKFEGEVILIGHSLGASVLLKFLAEEGFRNPIAGLFLISTPFWGSDDEWGLPEDFAARLPRIPNVFLYHSTDDPEVSFTHLKRYAARLPQAKIREIPGAEHVFSSGLPQLIDDLHSIGLRQP